jgi:hypothetical protein
MPRAARTVAAVGFLVLCLASIVRTVVPTAIHWHSERIRFEGANERQSRLYAALISLPTVDPFTFEQMRAALRPGDTYAIQMGLPREAAAGSWIETFTRYYLLPHIMVSHAREADVVLSFHATPLTLGVPVTDVRRVAHDLIVSRVVRSGT